jgi:hypothetical protein
MSRQPTSMTAELPARPAPAAPPLAPVHRLPSPTSCHPLDAATGPSARHQTHPRRRPRSVLPFRPLPADSFQPPCRCSPLPPCCSLAPPRSAPGPTKTSVMWWVEEGGPRVGAKWRGGDPLPQCQAQNQISPASGQQGVRLGVRLIDVHPNEHPDVHPAPQTAARTRPLSSASNNATGRSGRAPRPVLRRDALAVVS